MTLSSVNPTGVSPSPSPAHHRLDRDQLFAGGGEDAALMRSIDWSKTPLGPVEGWSQALRTMVGLLLRNRTPMLLWWGPKFVQLYNDAYRPVPGDKHPRAMGQPASECWSEIWHIIGPMVEAPFRGEPATTSDDLALLINRKGFVEETHFIVAYSPVPDETVAGTGIGGVLATVTETTEQVYGQRQLRTLRELGARAAEANTAERACAQAAQTFAQNDRDVPFALFYLLDEDGAKARLVSRVGFGDGAHAAAPAEIDLTADPDSVAWPIARLIARREPEVLDLGARAALPTGAWTQAPGRAIAYPLSSPDAPAPYGVLICGVSPHRALNAGYRTFFELAVAQVVTAIRNATAYQTERRRAELLAEIDHAKTAFFSNVSHEFRTPLTLMLGPAEDALADQTHPLARPQRERIELVRRSGMRLQKLVNTLLDFARSEAGRARGSFVATDLAALTIDLASGFRSVVENAGLALVVECDPLPEPVYVDTSMWEKIVLNLLSNAFKFTFEGRIRVTLRTVGSRAELTVEDTGSGIPAHELPRIFERFHRVEGAPGRSHEGSGIGLALVRDLVTLHGGSVEVESTLGAGSSFRVSIPFGDAHVPQDRASAPPALPSTAVNAAAFVAEAERWIDTPPPRAEGDHALASTSHARILVVDDNADMRDYVRRLLATRWNVETAADGAAALQAARRERPDLILSDVMMPGLSGFELVHALRSDERTRRIPIVLLSARAGEEARIDGLQSGADDYLTKPFSARELLARVNTHLEMARLRSDADTINRIASSLTGELDLQRLLQLLTDEATTLVGAQFGAFFYNVQDDAGERYTLYTLSGAPRVAFECFPMPRNTAIFAPTFNGERAVIRYDDVMQQPHYGQSAPYHGMPEGHLPVRSYLAAPVFSRSGEVLGGLFFGHGEPGMFSERSERLLAGVAAQGAIAIDNARLYERTKKQEEQVRDLLAREQTARATAESASRAKDEFLAILGHELRNPLAPILTALQLMKLTGGDAMLRERRIIERQVSHVVRLVDDLLDVSRITRGKIDLNREHLELADVVAKAIEMASPLIEQKRHRLGVAVASEGLGVYADPVRLAQVVSNLLTNAAKYTEAGGDITIYAERRNGSVVLHVRDTGIGIEPEMIDRVFDSFVQADQMLDRSLGGLGLGLTIVRSLVVAHGGTIHATSMGKGRGSEFVMTLPFAEDAATGALPADVASAPIVRPDARCVLVVDDNHDAADLLADGLRANGHSPVVAYDGPEALTVAAALKPDLAFLDIGLPAMDGYELAQRLRQMPGLSGIRLIAVTGYGQASDRMRSKVAGFDEHLVKPIDVDRAAELLVRLTAEARSDP